MAKTRTIQQRKRQPWEVVPASRRHLRADPRLNLFKTAAQGMPRHSIPPFVSSVFAQKFHPVLCRTQSKHPGTVVYMKPSVPPCPANFCIFSFETGFCHVGQAGLKLLTSSNLPALVSQSAGVTDVSHHVWPGVQIFSSNP